MLRVEEACELLLHRAPPRRVERVPLEDALGLVLAEDVHAPEPLPAFARSGMDGYAVRSADTLGATREQPVVLRPVGVIPAGHPREAELAPGTTVAIMTGGAVPPGADAVIRLEEVRVTPEGVLVFRPVPPMENVAPVGEDVREGELILEAGHLIRPQEINLLAALGILEVPVFARPRVGILSTGDELVPAHQTPGPGQIRNSNSPGVAALVRAAGGVPIVLGVARDVTEVIAGMLREAAGCDLILTTGGVSVGRFDVVREALTILGAEQLFWRVSIKPGTPVCASVLEGRLVIGLSGNPAAAITDFDLLVRPLLDHLLGRRRLGLRAAEGVLDQPVLKTAGVTRYLRARAYNGPDGEIRLDTSMAQRAGVLSSMSHANAYAVVPAHAGPLPAGARVRALLLDDADVFVPPPRGDV
ncbi:molybdopterin molybdotransferase MoeA [Symbiobacterium thermophilum]|uniref:molybdopterin molybdotransferase MoeA n=1 Tax=Symbiobacterium thermophilum TaxID=2734 RepID=UPI0035C6CF03